MSCDDYEAIGSSSKEECCEDYPSYCKTGQRKLECPTLRPYKHFKFSTCHPSGWNQKNNDCWLDSALYALFGSERLSDRVSSTLDDIATSENVHEREFAINISNYLEGLNDLEWSKGDCKQLLKNNISNAIWGWNEEHAYTLGMGELKDYAFTPDLLDDVGTGPLRSVFTFLAAVDSRIKYVTCNSKMLLSESVPAALRECSESKIIFLSANRLSHDNTSIRALKHVKNATLQSVVFGRGPHIIATTHCNNEFAIYDNQGDGDGNTVRPMFDSDIEHAEELMFIYLLNPGCKSMRKPKAQARTKQTRTKRAPARIASNRTKRIKLKKKHFQSIRN